MSVQIDTISWVEPSFGRFGERFLEGPKVVIKDVQKRKVKGCAPSRGTAFREAQQHELSWCLSWKYMNACDLS